VEDVGLIGRYRAGDTIYVIASATGLSLGNGDG
jgi:hypothetical protein